MILILSTYGSIRSRSRSKKKSKKLEFSRKGRSDSESVEYKHDREVVEVKMVVPRRLGQDSKELKYIESLCKSTLQPTDQVLSVERRSWSQAK